MKNPCEGCIINNNCSEACEEFKSFYTSNHPDRDCEYFQKAKSFRLDEHWKTFYRFAKEEIKRWRK